MDEKILKAIEVFNDGGIVIFPTDTAYGIGCRIDRGISVERLFEIRRRPHDKAVPVLVSGVEMARKYLIDVPADVEEKLINKFWPGALTIVLPYLKDKAPALVCGYGQNLGVRMPANETILNVIEKVGVPILGPSANFAGDKTPYTYKDLDPELIRLADFVLEGDCELKKQSTVIDCSMSPWQILRQGGVVWKEK